MMLLLHLPLTAVIIVVLLMLKVVALLLEQAKNLIQLPVLLYLSLINLLNYFSL